MGVSCPPMPQREWGHQRGARSWAGSRPQGGAGGTCTFTTPTRGPQAPSNADFNSSSGIQTWGKDKTCPAPCPKWGALHKEGGGPGGESSPCGLRR